MSEHVSAGFSWTCPACARRVPIKVTTCRCGHEADAADLAPPPPPEEPVPETSPAPATHGTAMAVVASLFAVLVGGFVWINRAHSAPAPAVESPTATEAPAPSAVAATTAAPSIPDTAARVGDAPTMPASSPAPIVLSIPVMPAETGLALQDVISRAMPAVVRVETNGGFGTGFFVRSDTILTNVHVVNNTVSVTIRRADGTTAPARVETSAPELDIAVLRLDNAPASQATVTLGSGIRARVGEEVVALGSPLGLQNTVTRGIVSAVRKLNTVTLVQTDAAVNPGNSGGPLLDRSGAAIGIATMSMRSAVAQGLSFAVAIDHAVDLLAGKRQLGATGTPLSNLSQAMTGAPSTDTARDEKTRAFEQAVAGVARRADALDNDWRRFRAGCYEGRVAGSFDREWFALFDARTMQGAVAPGCGSWFGEVRRAAFDIRDQVQAIDEAARQADVFPGVRRDIWRRYRLEYSGWDR
jgi:S1-C subfamily serine protease